MSRRIVSFSLYGTAPKYCRGILENARIMPDIYPGWVMRVYCADDVDTSELEKFDVEIERMGVSHEHSGMLWRFLPMWEDGVERAIFRDGDSIVNPREKAAVDAWIASGLDGHCMNDHMHHTRLPVMGGMWGIKGGVIPHIEPVWTRYLSNLQRRVSDMYLLQAFVWPHIEGSCLRHASIPMQWPSVPFPKHDPWVGFVGQQHDDDWKPVWTAPATPDQPTGEYYAQTTGPDGPTNL